MAIATTTKAELEEALENIWVAANEAEGSRSGMQDALDNIQERVSEVIPDIEVRLAGDELEDAEDDFEDDLEESEDE